MTRTIEMEWTCSACGTRVKGRNKVCPQCGDPKDASEAWEMPGDTRSAATVTDPALLRRAGAGADWRCGACGANQSALESACTQCGAPRSAGGGARADADPAVVGAPPRRSRWVWMAVASVVVLAGACSAYAWWAGRAVDLPAVVAEHRWERAVDVERYAIVDQEGFAEDKPADALEVRALGTRHHHDEQVLDGYDTRTYSVDVACGEDCTTSEPSCSETCTSDDNGFATCSETCSGGGETCTTRYCSEQRSEQVPRYRSEPRYQDYFAWRAWRWAVVRTLPTRGTGLEPAWAPDASIALKQSLGPGEDEREARHGTYTVTFDAADADAPGGHVRLDWSTEDEGVWRAYVPGSAHVLRVDAARTTITGIDPKDG